eukprot:1034156-Lingulodinium_polyedra.AAC.1
MKCMPPQRQRTLASACLRRCRRWLFRSRFDSVFSHCGAARVAISARHTSATWSAKTATRASLQRRSAVFQRMFE